MPTPKSIKVSTAIVDTGPAKLFNISFNSDNEDLHVDVLDGGSSGTSVWYHKMETTTQIGEKQFSHSFTEDGADFTNGLYIKLTKDGSTAADGDGYVNIEYKDLNV